MPSIKTPLWLLMILICFPQLSETIYTPSLPDLAKDLSVNNALAEWTLSVYFLGFALGVAFFGNYSDIVGRKKAILQGIILYFFSCLSCYLSHNIILLLLFRALQAFGISVGSVVVQSILRESYASKEKSVVFSKLNMGLSFSPALGPFLGGFMTDYFGWKSNFLLLSILIFAVLILCSKFLKETYTPNKKSFSDSFKLISQIFNNPKIMIFALLTALFNGIMFSYYSHAPFLFIDLLNLNEKQYGMLGIFAGLGVILGSLISIRLNKIWPSEKVIKSGCLGCFFAIVLLNISIFSSKSFSSLSTLHILLPMFLFFSSFSVAIPAILATALSEFQTKIGAASSIFGCIYYVLTAFFNFLMGLLDNKTFTIMPLYFLLLSYLIISAFYFYKFFIGKRDGIVLQK